MAITNLQVVTGYYDTLGTPSIESAVTAQLAAGWIPQGAPVLTDVYGQVAQSMVKSTNLTTTAYTIATGATPMAPDATWDTLGNPTWIESGRYLQAYTKGDQVSAKVDLANQVDGILPIANGGTGVSTQAAMWGAIRPVGATPLSAAPVNNMDATTKQWVESAITQSSNSTSTDIYNSLATTGGASLINAADGNSVQEHLNADRKLYKEMLALDGYTLVSGSFKQGATVSKKYDVVWNPSDGKFYTYKGTGTLPVTVPAGSSPTSDWGEATRYSSFVVGNDTSTAYYDFSELADALKYISGMKGTNQMTDTATFRIVIPTGRHVFNAIRMRGADFANVQIWGAGSSNTIIECVPDGITDGIWWGMRFASFGDLAGMRFEWGAGVTSPTDVTISCQRWYGSGGAPWLPAKTVNFIDMLASCFGRISDVLGVGDTTGVGVRLGTFINAACSTIQQIDGVEARNLRDMIVAYNGTTIGSGYNVIRGVQVYNFIVNHESTVMIRLAAASAFNTTSTVRTGSIFVDTFRGKTVILAASEAGVTRFDTLFLMNAGDITCGIVSGAISVYNKIQESYGDCSKLVTKLRVADTNILLSNNQILQLEETASSDVNGTSRKYGTLTYTGNGGPNLTTAIPAMVRKITIRNRTTNMSITLIPNQVLVNASGTNCAWYNSTAGNLVVYTGDFNTNGVVYDLVWER